MQATVQSIINQGGTQSEPQEALALSRYALTCMGCSSVFGGTLRLLLQPAGQAAPGGAGSLLAATVGQHSAGLAVLKVVLPGWHLGPVGLTAAVPRAAAAGAARQQQHNRHSRMLRPGA